MKGFQGTKTRVTQNGGHLRMNVIGMVCPRTGQFFAIEASHCDSATFQALTMSVKMKKNYQSVWIKLSQTLLIIPKRLKKLPVSERYYDKRSNCYGRAENGGEKVIDNLSEYDQPNRL